MDDNAPTPDTASKIGRNITVLTGGQLVTWTMTLIWTFVVPRALGPAGMGLIVTGWAVAGVLGVVLGLGTRNYLTREMVVAPDRAPELIGTAVMLRVALAPLFAIAVILYTHFAQPGHEGTLVLYLAAGATILTLLAEPMQAAFQSQERMEYLAYSDVINKSAQGLLGVVLALVGFRAVGITGCWLAVSAAVVILDVLWLRPHVRIALRTTGRRMLDMTKHSVAYWAFGVFFMIYLWIDSVMLSLMTSEKVVGWYGVPTKLFQTLLFVPVIVSTAWLPRLVAAFEHGPERLRDRARTPLELVLVVSLPIAAATALAAGPMIHLLYGPAYDRAVPVMVILGLCIPPMYLNIMLSQVLIAAKRQVLWTWVMAGATVFNPLCNAVLIQVTQHRYGNGAIGAAISLLATEVLIVAVGFVIVGARVLTRTSIRHVMLVAAMSGALWAVGEAARPFGVVVSFLAAGATFAGLAAAAQRRFVIVPPDTVDRVRTSVSRRIRGHRDVARDEIADQSAGSALSSQ